METQTKPIMNIDEIAKYTELQNELSEKEKKEQEELASYLVKYNFCEPLKNNTALTRKEKKSVLKALKAHNDKELEELFDGEELEEMKKAKASFEGLTNEQKEAVFDEIIKSRKIDEPSDLTLSEIYNFVDLVIGRTFNLRLFEGK